MDRETHPFESISPFAIDPFVAQPVENSAGRNNDPPKTIEEILQSINGYKCSPDQVNSTDRTSQAVGISKDPQAKNAVSAPLGEVMSNDQNQKVGAVPVNVIPSSSVSQQSPDWDDVVEPEQLPEFDVRVFGPDERVELGQPEPIRCAFDVDQDFFDYASIEARAQQLEQLESGLAAVVAPQDPNAERNDDVFYVNANETVYIDGKQGYGYIDLACFDVSRASFEANQITVRLDSHSQFSIDYRNVTHAMFAGGVEVELAANEIGFLPSK